MNLSYWIARRYFLSRRNFQFITVISIISIVGIAVGVAALICVMSIFNGFRQLIENQIVGFDPHIRLTNFQNIDPKRYDSLLNKISSIDFVENTAEISKSRLVAVNGSEIQVLTMISLPSQNQSYYQTISNSVRFGSFEIYGGSIPGIVLGVAIGETLKVVPGDTIILYSPDMIESSIRTFSRNSGVRVRVSGLFQTNQKDYDWVYGFSDTSILKKLFKNKLNYESSIDLRLNKLENFESAKEKISSIMPPGTNIMSWKDLNSDLYKVMDFERVATFLILGIIIMIAAFNVLVSLSMTVIEKKKDIGVLKALGFKSKSIRNVFLYLGILIGIISTVMGTALGLGLCYGQINFHWFGIDSNMYIVNSIPVLINYSDVITVILFSNVLSFLATLYPSYRALNTSLTESIKEE